MARPTLLLTRPAASSVRFVSRLKETVAMRAELVISPLLEIIPMEGLIDLTAYDAVIFTSVNGVSYAPAGEGRRAFCVGEQTAAAAKAKGWRIGHVALDADGLVAFMQGNVTGSLLHLSGTHQRGDIAERLKDLGFRADRQAIYDQRPLSLSQAAQSALDGEERVVLPLFSPRTAAYFAQQANTVARVHAVAMSTAVANELKGLDVAEIGILSKPTRTEMVRAVELLLLGDRLP